VERLPPFSPDFNPIEKLWKNTNPDSTHMKYFKTFEDLHDSVVKTFNTLYVEMMPSLRHTEQVFIR